MNSSGFFVLCLALYVGVRGYAVAGRRVRGRYIAYPRRGAWSRSREQVEGVGGRSW